MSSIGDLVANLVVNHQQWASGLAKANSQLASFAGSATALVAPVAGIIAGVWGTSASLAAAREDVQAMQGLKSVLKATGGAAELSGDQIGKLAQQLQGTTNFADEVTVHAAAMLATFKNIKGDNFKEILKLSQDWAALTGTDLQSSAKAFGKALNDPAESFAKLAKMGVQFTNSQEKQITAMQKAGDMAGAQAAMIKALSGSFGGYASSVADAGTQIKNAVGDVGEEIGKILLPMIKSLASVTIPFLQNWGGSLAQVAVAIGAVTAAYKIAAAAQKTVAIGQALIMSLGGPAAWAQLAAGAAIFAGALYSINTAMAEVATTETRTVAAAKQFVSAGHETADVVEKIAKKLTPLSRQLNLAAFATANWKSVREAWASLIPDSEKFADRMHLLELNAIRAGEAMEFQNKLKPALAAKESGFTSAIEKMSDEIRILKGEATEASLALEKMAKFGLNKDQLGQFDEMDQELQWQKFLAEQRKLRDEEAKKKFDAKQHDAGLDHHVGAAMRGSSESLSAIFRAMRENEGSKGDQQIQLQRDAIELAKEANSLLRDGNDKPAISLVPGEINL